MSSAPFSMMQPLDTKVGEKKFNYLAPTPSIAVMKERNISEDDKDKSFDMLSSTATKSSLRQRFLKNGIGGGRTSGGRTSPQR